MTNDFYNELNALLKDYPEKERVIRYIKAQDQRRDISHEGDWYYGTGNYRYIPDPDYLCEI